MNIATNIAMNIATNIAMNIATNIATNSPQVPAHEITTSRTNLLLKITTKSPQDHHNLTTTYCQLHHNLLSTSPQLIVNFTDLRTPQPVVFYVVFLPWRNSPHMFYSVDCVGPTIHRILNHRGELICE